MKILSRICFAWIAFLLLATSALAQTEVVAQSQNAARLLIMSAQNDSIAWLRQRAWIRLGILVAVIVVALLIVGYRKRRGYASYLGSIGDPPEGLHGVRSNNRDSSRPNYVGPPPPNGLRGGGTIGSMTGTYSSSDPRDIYRPRE